jgi:UDP-N-acetylmuramate dehydrogenase
MNILEHTSLKNYNTFGIDVKARAFAKILSENDLPELLALKEFIGLPKLVIGGGSNILLTKDFNGLVVLNSIPGLNIIDEDNTTVLVEAGAGVQWHEFVQFCVDRNYGGVENMSLIPGTAGAAPLQNIGAYGQELKDVFFSLKGISTLDLAEKNYFNQECNFGYRDSIFKHELKGKFIITQVTLRLKKNPAINLNYAAIKNEIEKLHLQNVTIKDISNVVCAIRKTKLPDPEVLGNAGSFFKNPEIDYAKFEGLKKEFPDISGHVTSNGKVKLAAGWLIEKCGWKGKRVGNTGSHATQALVLVNYGGATGDEVLNFAAEIKNSVYNKFGITLHEEVNIY